MSQNRCDRCGRPIKDPNAKYGWRCAEIIAAGGSLTIDLSAIFAMLEKYADFSFESQNDLLDISEIFEKMLTLSSAPYSMQAENDYVEKGAALAFAMFSNYDELGDKARKSAVSHFIEEMHRAEETLPPPSLRYTLAEQMNNKLIDYYEEENNPNTNDTVEDTIDELFGNIPLYHYLNAMFARTEAEFEDSLIKGIEGSLNAFMSLPYASSMMGDIAVVGPQTAFVPDPYVPQPEVAGKKTAQVGDDFGKMGKVVEHPGQKVNWDSITIHGTERMAQRGVTQSMVDDWVANGKVLRQSSGNHIYITREGAVVLNNAGELVTTYPKADFDANMLNIVKQLFGE